MVHSRLGAPLRALGRPVGAVDPSVITAAIQGGAAVTTAAIPVVADAAKRADAEKKKASKKKSTKKAKSSTAAKTEAPVTPAPEAASTVPWGPLAIGGAGLLLAAVLVMGAGSASAATPSRISVSRRVASRGVTR